MTTHVRTHPPPNPDGARDSFENMDEIRNRALYLLRLAGPKRLSQLGETNHERWKNISKGAIRMGTEELAVLVRLYPHYAFWLISGETVPEAGQTSPLEASSPQP
ncbi:DNA-binding protein [Metapseudomonas otitidis]|uniref:DNA-binding protein n=2 Tax=Pseudomonadales TaxID=72274 RepID=UPI001FB8AEFC|nr:DNA-binding protein [Pseudomonas otitidis]